MKYLFKTSLGMIHYFSNLETALFMAKTHSEMGEICSIRRVRCPFLRS